MNFKIVASFLAIFLPLFLYGQQPHQEVPDSVNVFLSKSLEVIRTNAINRDSVDWKSLEQEIGQRTREAKTYEDAAKVFPYIFQQIDDHHGALKIGKQQYSWNTGFVYTNQNVKDAVKKYKNAEARLLKGNIGYILVPGNSDFSGKYIDRDAQQIRDAIAKIDRKSVKGWILDLRLNTGGSMYQMLAGLSGLLGDGKVGSFINQHGDNDGSWIIRKGNIYLDSNQVSKLPEHTTTKKFKPLAVLISGMTASSGEVTAISTIGREKSILIGENSAGYTTANEGFQVNAYAGLNLAVDYDADRNGKVYKNLVLPDISINGGDNFEDLLADTKINRAIKWISRGK